MRADRLLSIMWLLQSRGRHSAATLAARLEVTPRTIQRDVDALATAGVPVVSIRGRAGGFELLAGYRPAVTALTTDESLALFAGISAAAAESLGLGAPFASALRKTLAAVPEPSRRAAAELSDRIIIDPEGWLEPAEQPGFAVVREAVLHNRRLQLRYQGRGRLSPSVRTIDPYGLVNSAGVWYLVGSHRGTVKFFRASRISQPKVLETTATRPPNLDLAALWQHHRDEFRTRIAPVSVLAIVHPRSRATLADRSKALVETGRTHRIDDEPWAEVAMSFADEGHAIAVFLALGADAVILQPDVLREAAMAKAQGAIARASSMQATDVDPSWT